MDREEMKERIEELERTVRGLENDCEWLMGELEKATITRAAIREIQDILVRNGEWIIHEVRKWRE